jgi:hypothetical protein
MFKDIPGFEGLYAVSKSGDIYSHRLRKPLTGRFTNHKSPRKRVTLKDSSGISKEYFVHRLVALTYIPNPNNLPFINHKNGQPLDNRVRNLEWCTHSENMQHAYRVIKAYHKSKINQQQADHIKSLKGKVTAKKIAEVYGISQSTVGHIWTNRKWRNLAG